MTNDQLWDGTQVLPSGTSSPRISAFMTDNVLSQWMAADYGPLTSISIVPTTETSKNPLQPGNVVNITKAMVDYDEAVFART